MPINLTYHLLIAVVRITRTMVVAIILMIVVMMIVLMVM